ncbi:MULTISPECIES: hypothetical protein [Bradyrhizobium]|jgi:hypothetical protein|uniref:hypothetical protein n=1 Tax=Bradyrhizobium TaxID=374 RepID=UPI0004B8ABCE|nr:MULTISPECIES: hypothetical protein [Bradyrhizobium]MCS3446035.1 hypothetical protein [Bradyrhizobium elkanii]MCS3562833.1 hypothetical protein [Bradyrhizobium elkanii]MCW2147331.1 hypothetical protein [Bradyrhizobium elkanii]MCW2353590.1 hypothetical protein [Bradyrhizobium elkanii]MCW2380162.1 hypothetical protein [Bradyrhizobium elkanii]
MRDRFPLFHFFGASLVLALTVLGTDVRADDGRTGLPKEGLAAMDILANIIIPAVRDAH